MKTSKNRNGENILSSWLPPRPEESSSDDLDLNSLKQVLRWLGAEVNRDSDKPVIKKPPIPATIATKQEFNETIIRVFSGEPKRVVPSIQNQKNSQSMLDFLGRGFAIQGPANHSQPLTSRHQKPSVNQKSFLDFATNPFASPSSTIVAPRVIQPNNHKATIIYC